jgi:hypothetical protein
LEVNYDYDRVTRWKAKDWARPMARISSDASADLVDQAVAMAFGHCRSTNYVRVQVCSLMNVVKIQFTILFGYSANDWYAVSVSVANPSTELKK